MSAGQDIFQMLQVPLNARHANLVGMHQGRAFVLHAHQECTTTRKCRSTAQNAHQTVMQVSQVVDDACNATRHSLVFGSNPGAKVTVSAQLVIALRLIDQLSFRQHWACAKYVSFLNTWIAPAVTSSQIFLASTSRSRFMRVT